MEQFKQLYEQVTYPLVGHLESTALLTEEDLAYLYSKVEIFVLKHGTTLSEGQQRKVKWYLHLHILDSYFNAILYSDCPRFLLLEEVTTTVLHNHRHLFGGYLLFKLRDTVVTLHTVIDKLEQETEQVLQWDDDDDLAEKDVRKVLMGWKSTQWLLSSQKIHPMLYERFETMFKQYVPRLQQKQSTLIGV